MISAYLSDFFNAILSQCISTYAWKEASVTAIHKKRDAIDVTT